MMTFRYKVISDSFMILISSQQRNLIYCKSRETRRTVGAICSLKKACDLNSNRTILKDTYLYTTLSQTPPHETSGLRQEKPESTSKKHKSDSGPMVTLIGTDDKPIVLALSEAEKIAKRRDLKLVRIVELDKKSQRPIYRLMTGAQFYEEDRKQRQEKAAKKDGAIKGDKLLTLSDKITTHDLSSRLKHISKWLSKHNEVRIIINGNSDNMKNAEQVYDTIEEYAKTEGRIVQKRQKGSEIRFQILPPKEKKEKDLQKTDEET